MTLKVTMQKIIKASNNRDKKCMAFEDSGAKVSIATLTMANYEISIEYEVS